MNTLYSIVLADVVRSSTRDDFVAFRDSTLSTLTQRHQDLGWTESAYAVTAWDEFQAVLASPSFLPHVLWEIRRDFQPLKVRVGFGMGSMKRHGAGPPNVSSSGEAFVRARQALEQTKKGKGTDPGCLTLGRTGDPILDLALNSAFPLIDLLAERITPSQWKAISAYERVGRQDQVASLLHKHRSTISRALKRSGYWSIRSSLDALQDLVARQISNTSAARGSTDE